MDRREDPDWLERAVRNPQGAELLAPFGFQSGWEWAAYWAGKSSRVLFADADEFLTTRHDAARSFEPRRAEILEQAERVCHHEIAGWGDVIIRHGDVIDFSGAGYGDYGVYGFHYWRWARPLLWAFLLTEDSKYLVKFEQLFNQWFTQRDRVKGTIASLDPIWYELGLGFRNRVFLEFYALASDRIQAITTLHMMKTLLGAGRWLAEEQKPRNRLGNWQIIGCAGLAQISLMVPEISEARAWARVAVERLSWHLEKDFYPDGCHWERVPSDYMLTAYRDIANVATMLGDKGQALRAGLAKCGEFYRAIMTGDGSVPGINDGRRRKLPARIAGAGAAKQSRCFRESGFTVLRSEKLYMLINHGSKAGGHTHEDALSFELHAFGRPMAVDAGIGTSYDDPHHLTWYRRAIAHNMVTVNGEDPDRATAAGEDVVFRDDGNVQYFAATHRGYEKSHGVVHRRRVLIVRGQFVVIWDEIDGADRQLEWNLHVADPALAVAAAPGDWREVRGRGLAQGTEIDWTRFEGKVKRFAVVLYPFEREVQPIGVEVEGRTVIVKTQARVERVAVPED